MSSLCTERLANNLSAPVGYEASMSTTGPVFLGPAMKIQVTLQSARGVCWGAGWGRIRGRVGGLPGSVSVRKRCSCCEANLETRHKGIRACKCTQLSIYHMGIVVLIVPSMWTMPELFRHDSCCATVFLPLQVMWLYLWKATGKHRKQDARLTGQNM